MIPLPPNPIRKLTLEEATQINVKNQVKNLLTYPWLRELYDAEELKIYGWFYYVESAEFHGWDEKTDQFLPLNDRSLFGRTPVEPLKQQIRL
jgi:carbonic anhydrase